MRIHGPGSLACVWAYAHAAEKVGRDLDAGNGQDDWALDSLNLAVLLISSLLPLFWVSEITLRDAPLR
jgi:hypothetical protein